MTDDEIITGLRSGGKQMALAVKALYMNYQGPMLRHFMYQRVPLDDAQDILQETLMRIIGSAHRYTGAGKASSWFWQIARNCHVDYQRKQGRIHSHEVVLQSEESEEEPLAALPEAIVQPEQESVDECVSDGLERFRAKEPERAYALMLQMDGVNIADIGERIGRTMTAAKQYLYECRKKIAPYIAHCRELLAN